MLLRVCGCRLVTMDEVVEAVREAGRGKRWTWIDTWIREHGSDYANDRDTVLFEFPTHNLTGPGSLEFTQYVWRCQPSTFEYEVWSGRCFVRMWWDPNRILAGKKS
ncbi:hypothetical protein [Singulisphaera sp. PoT]|uniref:hypothetical protein n=1 Tax=Singulisphaera sp. PoT TaxID=3411797 RepID=UPI003BF503E9